MTPHRRTRVKVCCIATVQEARLAVCSGLHTVGRLDEEKLAAFMTAVASADESRN